MYRFLPAVIQRCSRVSESEIKIIKNRTIKYQRWYKLRSLSNFSVVSSGCANLSSHIIISSHLHPWPFSVGIRGIRDKTGRCVVS